MTEILIIDDDSHIRQVVEFACRKAGFDVRTAADGRLGLEAVATKKPDLVVLDVLMPEMDGLEVCRRIRGSGNLPIIFLTSVDEELDRIIGLELGADDYVTKPFSPRELVARIRTVLRRTANGGLEGTGPAAPLVIDALSIDPVRREIKVSETMITLTASEFSLLQTLATWPGKVYTRDALMARIYADGTVVSDRTIDSHIKRMRKKFESTGFDPVETVHGAGYRLGKFAI